MNDNEPLNELRRMAACLASRDRISNSNMSTKHGSMNLHEASKTRCPGARKMQRSSCAANERDCDFAGQPVME